MNTILSQEVLIVGIDIAKAVYENNTELAQQVCDTINSMELNDSEIRYISERIDQCCNKDYIRSADAFNILVDGINVVTSKEMLHRMFELFSVMELSIDEQVAYLESLDVASIAFNEYENYLFYARNLINLCMLAKRFDIMDAIREKLREVS